MRTTLLLPALAVLLGGCGWLWPKENPCDPSYSGHSCSEAGVQREAAVDQPRPDAPRSDVRGDAPIVGDKNAVDQLQDQPPLDAARPDAPRPDACSGAECLKECHTETVGCQQASHDDCPTHAWFVCLRFTFGLRCSPVCGSGGASCPAGLKCQPQPAGCWVCR